MKNNEKWIKVSKTFPCAICGKPDWCSVGEKGRCCMRIDDGAVKLLTNGGGFYPFDKDGGTMGLSAEDALAIREAKLAMEKEELERDEVRPDFGGMMTAYRNTSFDKDLFCMADNLGVLPKSLWELGASWTSDRGGYMAFPMHDGTHYNQDKPCGIRLRTTEGKKFAIKGSKSGIFFPYRALPYTLVTRAFICEGPTDTAAALSLGLFAIGRASCRGGESIIINCLKQLATEAIVVCDNDGAGIAGANILYAKIKMKKRKMILPCKDIRQFVREGGTAQVINDLLDNMVCESR
jgi:hypothetical protein